jgi:hypothetical protein
MKNTFSLLALLGVVTMCLNESRAQNRAEAQDSTADTTRASSPGILPLPIFFYTPETGTAGGAGLLFFFRPNENAATNRPSTTMLNFIYTEKKQIIAEASGEFYLAENLYKLSGGIQFLRFPQKFFGIGNNTSSSMEESYSSELYGMQFSWLRSLENGFQAGLSIFFENRRVYELIPGGLLSSGTILGSKDGITSGIGPLVTLDTRDNVFAPFTGSYYQFSIRTGLRALGSDYLITVTEVDLRKYLPFYGDGVMAFQAFGTSVSGDAPFHKLAELGGQNRMRGYYQGRYRDKNYVAVQAEYRLPLIWRFGGVAFAGTGDVAPSLSQFRLSDFKPSYGFGIRFAFEPKERLNLRLDFGLGDNSSGMYISVAEAF